MNGICIENEKWNSILHFEFVFFQIINLDEYKYLWLNDLLQVLTIIMYTWIYFFLELYRTMKICLTKNPFALFIYVFIENLEHTHHIKTPLIAPPQSINLATSSI